MARTPSLFRGGALRHRVIVERRATNTAGDGAGNFLEAWTKIGPPGELPARIVELRGDETVLDAKLRGQAITSVVLRADTFTRSITPDDRIVDVTNGRTFNVRHTPAPERRGYLELLCEAGAAIG